MKKYACHSIGDRSKTVMSEVGTVALIRGMRQPARRVLAKCPPASLDQVFLTTFPLSEGTSISGKKLQQHE